MLLCVLNYWNFTKWNYARKCFIHTVSTLQIRALNFSLVHSEAVQPSCCGASNPLMSEFLLFASVCMCVPASSYDASVRLVYNWKFFVNFITSKVRTSYTHICASSMH